MSSKNLLELFRTSGAFSVCVRKYEVKLRILLQFFRTSDASKALRPKCRNVCRTSGALMMCVRSRSVSLEGMTQYLRTSEGEVLHASEVAQWLSDVRSSLLVRPTVASVFFVLSLWTSFVPFLKRSIEKYYGCFVIIKSYRLRLTISSFLMMTKQWME